MREGEVWKTERIGLLIIIVALILIAIVSVRIYVCSLLVVLGSMFTVGIFQFFGGIRK